MLPIHEGVARVNVTKNNQFNAVCERMIVGVSIAWVSVFTGLGEIII